MSAQGLLPQITDLANYMTQPEKKKNSLKRVVRIVEIGIPVLAIFCAISLIGYQVNANSIFKEAITKEFQAHQETIVMQVAGSIEATIQGLTRDMESLAESPHVIDANSEECRDEIKTFYRANKDIVYAGYRMDAQGILVHMHPIDPNGLGADISYQDHVKKLFKTKSIVVSGLFRAVEGFEAIAIHVPVFKNGRLDGSVATIVGMAQLTSNHIRNVKIGNNGYAWLVDENGGVLYHPRSESIGKPLTETNLYSKPELEKLLTLIKKNKTLTTRIGGTLFAMSQTSIGDRIWTVILSTPYNDISGPLKKHSMNSIRINIAILALLLVAGAAAFRSVQLSKEKEFLQEKIGLEEELRKNRDHLDMIISNVPSGLYTVDKNRIVTTWNRTAEKLLGYTAGEIIGKPCSMFAMGACDGNCGMFQTKLPEPTTGVECKFRTKEGREILVSKNVDYLYDSSGAVEGGVESFLDITESKMEEMERINRIALEQQIERLKELDEAKSKFLSIVSHELRTPLAVILGNMGMARRGRYGDISDELAAKLDVSLRRGWQLNDLIANLLNLARIESGKRGLNKSLLRLHEKIADAVSEVADPIEKKGLSLTVNVSDDAAELWADESMFHRVLVNLIANSVKFTDENGEVKISTFAHGDMTGVSIVDNGIGIPADSLPRIFDRFYQADDSSTRKYGGTGLGLAIVKEIMDVHRGRIEVKSVEGEGTQVDILFPGENGELLKPSIIERTSSAAPARTGVIIVSRDSDLIAGLAGLMDMYHIKILSVVNIQEAAIALDREQVPLVVLDMDDEEIHENECAAWNMMVETGGLKLTALAYSSNRNGETMAMAARAGADFVLLKPFSKDEFIARASNIPGLPI